MFAPTGGVERDHRGTERVVNRREAATNAELFSEAARNLARFRRGSAVGSSR